MTEKAKRNTPIVFISSTAEDLEPFRKRARDAALALGFQPRMMEYFPASGSPPLEECLARVSGSKSEPPVHLLIAIVAHRYGWVPEGQADGEHKSITWLECQEAETRGFEVLAFLIDEKADWPDRHREGYQLTAAAQAGSATPELLVLVQKNIPALRQFKSWLSNGRVRSTFTNPDNLQTKILIGLQDWLKRNPEFQVEAAGDPSPYLRILREETAYIDIRGLQVGSGKASRFPIDELYMSLQTASTQVRKAGKKGRPTPVGQPVRLELEKALVSPRLVVIGDPGAGKSTFLRRICQLACRGILDGDRAAIQTLGLEEAPFPILVRLSELHDHRAANKGRSGAPAVALAPDWLAHLLASQWKKDTGLDAGFFHRLLTDEAVLLLLDGLDEVPTDKDRRALVKWIEKAAARWEHCRIVVTSRPATYKGEAVLPGFDHASIEDLEDPAIANFLEAWCQALFPADPRRADRHREELIEALRSRPEIRRMARNPVMLTALAVVHWNEKRLPEQRADLYESILNWLALSREALPHRPSPERSLGLLQSLALAMQDHEKGRQVQISRRQAAEAIAPGWRELPDSERLAAAATFLDQEEKDSGIVVRRGSEVRFWHLTFQEYLAARALAGLGDREQHQCLLRSLHSPEWKEVVLLLAGVLRGQGVERVDNLVAAVLDQLGGKPSLPDQARCAGILGAIVRDLAPMKYQPTDARYQSVLKQALGVFNRDRSEEVSIEVAIEAAEALGQAGDPRFEGDQLEKNWVEIPAGEFWMGAQKKDKAGKNFDPEADNDESPVHRVHLDAYRIGRYPVTVAEYQRFMQADGYGEEDHWTEGGFGEKTEPDAWEDQTQHPNRPVVRVSWLEAAAYAQWAGAQLPTEAQWERAARGTEGRKYPWGNRPEPNPQRLNFAESETGDPTPVGVYPQGSTPEGITDLAGNVLEWCQDWFGGYPDQLQKSPTGPKKGEGRVHRGGASNYDARLCRSSYRLYNPSAIRNHNIGFRVVLVDSSARTKKRKS
ncbi:MAG: SUMF1/EgtB/PvdO family nonheme iron enzyme [Acidobacteriota bacterium]